MMSLLSRVVLVSMTVVGASLLSAAPSQNAPAGSRPVEPQTAPDDQGAPPRPERIETDPLKILFAEIDHLNAELLMTRQELAQARLDAGAAQRELDELRQFIADNHQLGKDFEQYTIVKEIAERETRRKETEAARAKRDAEKADREARRQAARAEKAVRDAEADKVAGFRRNGFTTLGLDVYTSKMAFFYNTKGNSGTRVDYEPGLGRYLRPTYDGYEVDYSTMTISGSVVNASDETRNLGIAITFFDENGNQVGHEIIQINNARPNVPYPFTSKIEMALNREFDSSSTYVLYADPVEE